MSAIVFYRNVTKGANDVQPILQNASLTLTQVLEKGILQEKGLQTNLALILVRHDRMAIGLYQPTADFGQKVWIPPQGKINPGESCLKAAKRLVTTELADQNAPRETQLYISESKARMIGVGVNPRTRSGVGKRFIYVAAPVNDRSVVYNQNFCRAFEWVETPDALFDTLSLSPGGHKDELTVAAIAKAAETEMLVGWEDIVSLQAHAA